jgi:hypothetical protein
MTKKILFTILSAVLILTLTACGGDTGSSPRALPNEERIQNDLAVNSRGTIPAGQSIDSLEIVDSETDNDAGVHDVICKIFSNDGEVAYIKYLLVMYQRNADREWVLASVNTTRSNLWSTSPLAGVRDALVMETIMGAVIRIDDDDWVIDGDSMANVSITSRDTDLERYSDVVVASVKLQSDVLTAEGQMQVEFNYSDGWQPSDFRVHSPFTTSALPHTEFEMTDGELIDTVVRRYNAAATIEGFIDITDDDVSNFSLSQITASDKGATQTLTCTFDLDRKVAVHDVTATMVYQYDKVNGWQLQDFSSASTVKSVHMEGTRWVGRGWSHVARSFRSMTIDITEVGEDGSMRATITFPHESFSCTATGFIDKNDLTFSLQFETWIQSPTRNEERILRPNFYGRLNTGNLSIASLSEQRFDVTLEG